MTAFACPSPLIFDSPRVLSPSYDIDDNDSGSSDYHDVRAITLSMDADGEVVHSSRSDSMGSSISHQRQQAAQPQLSLAKEGEDEGRSEDRGQQVRATPADREDQQEEEEQLPLTQPPLLEPSPQESAEDAPVAEAAPTAMQSTSPMPTMEETSGSLDCASALPPLLAPPSSLSNEHGSSASSPSSSSSSRSAPVIDMGATSWEVEEIVEARESRGHIWYRVKWKEFNTMTWEEAQKLEACKELIDEFNAKQRNQRAKEGDGTSGSNNSASPATAVALGEEEEDEARSTASAGDKLREVQSVVPPPAKKRQKKVSKAARADEYEVEAILSDVLDGGVRYYEVKWVGWEKPTWEPEENLLGSADQLLSEYKEAQAEVMAKAKLAAKTKRTGQRRPLNKITKAKSSKQDSDDVILVEDEDRSEEATNLMGRVRPSLERLHRPGSKGEKQSASSSRRALDEKMHLEDAEGRGVEDEGSAAKAKPRKARAAREEKKWNGSLSESEEELPAASSPGRASQPRTQRRGKGREAAAGKSAAIIVDSDEQEEENADGQEANEREDDEERFDVERILEMDDSLEPPLYLIKWKGFPKASATWEPEDHLAACRELVDAFLQSRRLTRGERMAKATGDDDDEDEGNKLSRKRKRKA